MSQDRYEALQGSRLAAELDESQCRKLAGLMELVELKDGDVLVREGTSDDHLFVVVSGALAAGPKTYQVTGPVLEVKDDMIVVQKGKDKWEVARDKDTKITGDLKAGAKVTIEYTMKAATVEVKPEAKKK